MRNPYEVLGVPRSATPADIKRSFRQLAKRLHPDANKGDPTVATRFAELNAAYEILGDDETRTAFDRGKIDAEGRPTRREALRAKPRKPIVTGLMAALMVAATATLVVRGLTPQGEINASGDERDGILPRLGADEQDVSAQRVLEVDRSAYPEPLGAMQQSNPYASTAAPPDDREQVQLLIERSQELISEGDVAAGRALLRHAAEANDARAAFALGATYDPIMLTILGTHGVAADVSLARDWYKKASELGSQEAQERLKLLVSDATVGANVPRNVEPGIAANDTAIPVASAKLRKHMNRMPIRVLVPRSDPNGVYVAGERVGTDPDPNIRAQLLRDDTTRQLRTGADGS